METASVIIAIAALAFSVVSPVITAHLNNRHQLKMKQIEFNLERRAQAIENYVRAVGETIHTQRPDTAHCGSSYGEIFLYLPEDLWPLVRQINSCLLEAEYQQASGYFDTLCAALSKIEVRPSIDKKRKPDKSTD